MAYGYIIENALMADNVDTLNRTARCNVNVDGGYLVTVSFYDGQVATVALATAGAKLDLWMAYNPSERYTDVNGKLIPNISVDPRDYTNLKNRPFDVFKPQVGDVITFLATCVNGNPTKNQFLEPDGGGRLKPLATQTASSTSFKVLEVKSVPFPKAGIGLEYAKGYVCECVAN